MVETNYVRRNQNSVSVACAAHTFSTSIACPLASNRTDKQEIVSAIKSTFWGGWVQLPA